VGCERCVEDGEAVNRFWNIIIVPSDHAGTRQYTVSKRLALATLGLLLLLVLAIVVFLVDYARVLGDARTARTLQQENQELRRQVATIDRLNREVENLTALKAQVLAMLGVEGQDDRLELPDSTLARAMKVPAPELLGVNHLKAAASLQAYAPTRWPVEGYASKEFFEAEKGRNAHPGLDLVAPDGAPVHAAGRGRVVEASYDEDLGNYVVIDHGFGYSTLYGHNQRLLVHVGQAVDQGQVIALLGNTGRSSAPHLHFEIRVDGKPVDPRQYLTPK
jgi:murein DD-endopeptidase MepM/ murein hydrolase activator NlpD